MTLDHGSSSGFSAVDGCKDGSDEPGALEFDWLEVQLDSFRERGMQVSLRAFLSESVLIYYSRLSGMADGPRTAAYGPLL